jgi:transcriptional regulator with XRE-family HTH domain
VSVDPFLSVIRIRIKASRVQLKLRQEDAAEQAGIELRNWQRLEAFNPSRKFNPTLETLRAVARVLNTSVSILTEEPTLEELRELKRLAVGERPKRVFKDKELTS